MPSTIRAADGRLNLCLLQLPPTALDVINVDGPRPIARNAIRQLLIGGDGHQTPVLTDFAPNNDAVVIVAPEYAFSHDDWEFIDALVRQQQRRVVLIAGFGATELSKVADWAQGLGDTTRLLSWDQATAGLSTNRPVNGAWCWLHGFDVDTTCAVLLKSHLEQTTEQVQLDWLQSGTHHLRVAFDDLHLIPLICADLVQSFADGAATAVRRLTDEIQELDPAVPVLVTGCLLQTTPSNPNWAIALDNWLNHATVGRSALIAIANAAIDTPQQDEIRDSWRSMTGVFSRMTDMPKNQANLRATRGVDTASVRGAVLRLTSGYAAGGALSWGPYPPTGERFFWQVGMGGSVGPGGIPAPVRRPPEIAQTELVRFTRRIPPGVGWCPRVGTGLAAIRAHVESESAPVADELLASLLSGASNTECCGPDEISSGTNRDALTQALHGLATLITEPTVFAWRTTAGQTGQLIFDGDVANVLIWRDPIRTGGQIQHALGDWADLPGAHPPLVVVAAGHHGQPSEGPVPGHPRDNIETGPSTTAALAVGGSLAANGTDITQRRSRRAVSCVRLERLAEIYVAYDPTSDADRVAAFVDHLKAAVAA